MTLNEYKSGIIRHASSPYSLSLKITGLVYICFIPLVRKHRQCISASPELEREPTTNNCKSDALAIKLAELILNGS